jgi:hypothetical protein
MGAPATLGDMAPTIVGERERKEENLWMTVIIWTNWNLIKEPLGTS